MQKIRKLSSISRDHHEGVMDTTNLAVTIRYMGSFFALTQGADYIAQAAQAAVDILCFLQSLAGSTAVTESLRSSEVNQIQCALAALSRDAVVTN